MFAIVFIRFIFGWCFASKIFVDATLFDFIIFIYILIKTGWIFIGLIITFGKVLYLLDFLTDTKKSLTSLLKKYFLLSLHSLFIDNIMYIWRSSSYNLGLSVPPFILYWLLPNLIRNLNHFISRFNDSDSKKISWL